MKISTTGFMKNVEVPNKWTVYPEGVLDVADASSFMAGGDLVDEYGNRIYSFICFSRETHEYQVFSRRAEGSSVNQNVRFPYLDAGCNRENDYFELVCCCHESRLVALFNARQAAYSAQMGLVNDILGYNGIILRGDYFNLDVIMAIALMKLVKYIDNQNEKIDFFMNPTGVLDQRYTPAICFIGDYNDSEEEKAYANQYIQQHRTSYFMSLWIHYLQKEGIFKGVPFESTGNLFGNFIEYKHTHANGLYKEGAVFGEYEIHSAIDRAFRFMKEEYEKAVDNPEYY